MSVGPDDQSSVTIKLGPGYEAPWFAFKGGPGTIRRQILEAFGVEDETEVSLIELIAKSSVDAQAAYSLATGGATPTTGRRRASYSKDSGQKSSPKAEEASPADEEKAEESRNISRILGAIEAAKTPQELKLVWAKDQAAFSDSRLQLAYKSRNSALKQ